MMQQTILKKLTETGRPECPQCGYVLEGLPGPHNCPECGYAYEAGLLTWHLSKRGGLLLQFISRPILSGVLLLMTLCAYSTIERLVVRAWQGFQFRRVWPLLIVGAFIALVVTAWWRRWKRVKGEFLSIDDCGVTWRFDGETHRVRWDGIRDATLNEWHVGIVGKRLEGEEFVIPRQHISMTDVSVSDFIEFMEQMQGDLQSRESTSAFAPVKNNTSTLN